MTGYTRWFRRSRARCSSPLASCPRGALCESLCALFELSQPLCFPTVTRGRDSCALTLAASTCPSSCVFFSSSSSSASPFFRLFFFLRLLFYVLAVLRSASRRRLPSRGHVNRFFPLSFSSFASLAPSKRIRIGT